MTRVTLADVGRHVGVSAKTVSNVVNGTGWVGDEMRERIIAALEELGYRPNLAARQLRSGVSGMLALVVPDLREPYFAEFASRFVTAAQRRGITVLVAQTGGDREVERAIIEGEGLPALDAMVLSPLALTREDIASRRSSTPLILIGEHGMDLADPSTTHVGVDNVAAAAAATESLIRAGRTRIAAVGVQRTGSTATSRMRFEGYRRALHDAGLPIDERLLCEVGQFNRAEGSAAVDRLVASGAEFDGLVCFNDTLAFGAIYSLGTHRIAVPEAVSVIGFDDIEEGRFSTPAFATIDPGVGVASELILDLIADRDGARRGGHIEVPFTLVQR